jgi:hypothetical protein
MNALSERVSALESIFAKYNLGDWSQDQEVPWWLAIRIRPQDRFGPQPEPWREAASFLFEQQLVSAVQLAAQAKALQGAQGEGMNRLVAEIIDDWCGTPPRKGPRPHWGVIVEQLGILGDRFPTGSLLSEAAFDLARRVVNRAHEVHQQLNSQ